MDTQTITILSAGMGRQGSAILSLVEQGQIKPYDYIIFADTQREPKSVYDNVEYWRNRGHNIVTVTAGDLGTKMNLLPLYMSRGGIKTRQCTVDYKVTPIRSETLDILLSLGFAKRASNGTRRVNRGVQVIQHIGFSADEQYRVQKKNNNPKWLVNQYPLIELGLSSWDCQQLLLKLGHPIVRSSCIFCPYHSDDHIKDYDPATQAQLIEYDEFIRSDEFLSRYPSLKGSYLHRSRRPMSEVIPLINESPNQLRLDGFGLEALEHCDSPVVNCMT